MRIEEVGPTGETKNSGGPNGTPFSSNPDCDFSAGYSNKKLDLGDWRSEPPLPLEELFNDPAIQQRVGELISDAVQHEMAEQAERYW